MEFLSENYKHIKGWGVDADDKNEPTYPMKKYTGDDHKRLNYERAEQQPLHVEVLHSNERPSVTTVFGSPVPPSGFSGNMRRYAFRYSENNWLHWLSLLMADRVQTIEAIIEDLKNGHIPNIFKEKGLTAEWKYNRKGMIRKIIRIAAIIAVVKILKDKKKRLID